MEKRKNDSINSGCDNNTAAKFLVGLGLLWLLMSTGILKGILGLIFGTIGAVVGVGFTVLGTVIGVIFAAMGTIMAMVFGLGMFILPVALVLFAMKTLSDNANAPKAKRKNDDYTIV
ncbi:hypothetical protein G4Y79_21150 [Phototrophicus methaneseepsis]|uniref:Uncharacterized protein n=1 Tax=Phototrophicus methaneseepsis TaxID=2710758 RepID=A0A7S8E877_9CHLR|nr:hypothetical protein [Phototrophicus methaneseepsis]QPC82164.1 hypothetical protein G4Y79_21150 [Phototrophicus methaneseepsis]